MLFLFLFLAYGSTGFEHINPEIVTWKNNSHLNFFFCLQLLNMIVTLFIFIPTGSVCSFLCLDLGFRLEELRPAQRPSCDENPGRVSRPYLHPWRTDSHSVRIHCSRAHRSTLCKCLHPAFIRQQKLQLVSS